VGGQNANEWPKLTVPPCGNQTLACGIGYSKKLGWYYTDEIDCVRRLFRLFLEGDHTYEHLAEQTGFAQSSVTKILTNPVYSGWMVYREKRDLSQADYVPGPDGRQGYRRKIPRNPDEVIQFRLPLEPILSEQQFQTIQAIIEQNRLIRLASRTRPPQFTYNGFLFCDECDCNIYPHVGRDFFYFCRSKHPREKKKRELRGLFPCTNKYMLRDKLEPRIDAILTDRLTDMSFLLPLFEEYLASVSRNADLNSSQESIQKRLAFLGQKRLRILDSFHDGLTTKEERDAALRKIDLEVMSLKTREITRSEHSDFPADQVAKVVSVFAEWRFLAREQKRSLLSRVLPEIYVYRYDVNKATLRLDCDSGSRSKTARSPSAGPPCL
jgi:Recombinase